MFLEKSKVLGMGSTGKQEGKEKGRNGTLKSEGNMRIKDGRIERKGGEMRKSFTLTGLDAHF